LFGLRLKQLREDAGYSQYTFADVFKCSQSAVGNWEAGKREPGFSTLIKLADFFGVTTDYLLGRTDDPNLHVIDNPPELAELGASEMGRAGTEPFTPEQIEAIKREIEKHMGDKK